VLLDASRRIGYQRIDCDRLRSREYIPSYGRDAPPDPGVQELAECADTGGGKRDHVSRRPQNHTLLCQFELGAPDRLPFRIVGAIARFDVGLHALHAPGLWAEPLS
jgi:hypothetical protein